MEANCAHLLRFQCNIAHRWHSRAESSTDPFAKFFFCFSGFNALYFAWFKADDIRNSEGKTAGESLQIANLLQKLSSEEAEEILEQMSTEIKFFINRAAIQRMDKRTCRRFSKGEKREGRRAREQLGSFSSVDRLVALGKILYLVRSNLVHGSKAEMGDDKLVIEMSVGPLELLLKRAIELTDRSLLESM